MSMANSRKNIPVEMIEEILLHLPFKSLLRFSTVSKTWHSIIFHDATFAQRHKKTSSRQLASMIATFPSSGGAASTRPLSSIHHDDIIGDGEPLIYPFPDEYSGSLTPRHVASCGDLWLTEHGLSLFLWNPSTRTFRKLPRPRKSLIFHCSFGVGYDSGADDYKVVMFEFGEGGDGEVYSLRSDTWKDTEAFPGKALDHYLSEGGAAAGGAIHWLDKNVIISFDLSSEKYKEAPMRLPRDEEYYDAVVSVLRGKLCVALNYYRGNTIGVYLMQECEYSWAKVYEFDYESKYLSRDESGVIGLTAILKDDANALICQMMRI